MMGGGRPNIRNGRGFNPHLRKQKTNIIFRSWILKFETENVCLRILNRLNRKLIFSTFSHSLSIQVFSSVKLWNNIVNIPDFIPYVCTYTILYISNSFQIFSPTCKGSCKKSYFINGSAIKALPIPLPPSLMAVRHFSTNLKKVRKKLFFS